NSPELKIHDTSRLLVRFTDVPRERLPKRESPSAAKPGAPPQQAPAPAAASRAAPTGPTPSTTPPAVVADKPKSAPTPAKSPDAPAATEQPKQQPIDMTARSIEAEVFRCGEEVALDHLWAEGSPIDGKGGVQVRQEPAKKDERGVYIEGNALEMKC